MTSNAGDVIGRLLAVLGGLAAVQQLVRWITGRRADRGLSQFLESYADAEDADLARGELLRLTATIEELKSATPRIVRALHAEQRRAELAQSIGKEVNEFRALTGGLDGLDAQVGSTALEVIRAEIMPLYAADAKEQRRTRLLLTIILILLIVPRPFDPSWVVQFLLAVVVVSVAAPQELGSAAVWCGPIVTAIGCIMGLASGAFVTKDAHRRFRDIRVSRRWTLPGIPLLIILNALAMVAGNELQFDAGLGPLVSVMNGVVLGSATLIVYGGVLSFARRRDWRRQRRRGGAQVQRKRLKR